MPTNKKAKPQEIAAVIDRILSRSQESNDIEGANISPGWLFHAMTIYFHKISPSTPGNSAAQLSLMTSESQQREQRLHLAHNLIRFGGASVTKKINKSTTHIIVDPAISSTDLSDLRGTLAKQLGKERQKLAHIVKVDWIEESWKEKMLLDEEST